MAHTQTHTDIQTDIISKKSTIKHRKSLKNADGLTHRSSFTRSLPLFVVWYEDVPWQWKHTYYIIFGRPPIGGKLPPSGSATGCPLRVTLAMAEVREVTTSTVLGIEGLYNLVSLNPFLRPNSTGSPAARSTWGLREHIAQVFSSFHTSFVARLRPLTQTWP